MIFSLHVKKMILLDLLIGDEIFNNAGCVSFRYLELTI